MRNVHRIAVALATAVLACAGTGAAATETWNADPPHTSAQFTVTHLGISHVTGVIPVTSAVVQMPSDSNIPTRVSAQLNPKGVDTRNDDRDNDLRSAHFFDVATYPALTFVSTAIAGQDATHFTIAGDLTMHGVTKPVTLNAHYLGRMEDPRHRVHVAFEATTTIDRTQWGMTYGNPFAGNTIDLDVNVEAIKG